MSVYRGHARALESGYVYYKRINTDGYYPLLGKYVTSTANRIGKQVRVGSTSSKSVRAIAKAEISKEKKMLEEVFGITLDSGYYSKNIASQGDFKVVIDTFNELLNLKEVYERNKLLIKNTKGQKAVITWYPTYFMKAFEEYWPKVQEEFLLDLTSTHLKEVLDKYMPEICILGIKKMLKGPEVENAAIPPELKMAYASLEKYIGRIDEKESFSQQIYRTYQLDKVKEEIINQIEKTQSISKSEISGQAKKIVASPVHIHSRGGLALEAVENAIFQQIGSVLEANSLNSMKVNAIHTGQTGVKADNIITFSIDSELVYQTLKKSGKNRHENMKAFSELGERLSGLKSGFIVYSSDKNWSLNSNFGGYKAGNATSAMRFLDAAYKNSSVFASLLGAINQLGEGALLEGDTKNFEMLLAQDIAHMLFDDYTTIGEKDTAGRAIHVMNLNGIIIPLSMILTLLANAIDDLDREKKIKDIVNVQISAPKILWETQEEQQEWMDCYGVRAPRAWEVQRSYVLENTKIEAKFLKNFRQLVISLL